MPEVDYATLPDPWASIGLALGHAIILASVLIVALQYDIHMLRKQPSLTADNQEDVTTTQLVISYMRTARWVLLAGCIGLIGVRLAGIF
ncbi:hypothetical protein FJY94_04760 [Candidatus Kaiserbacteria bacterium]|nr:hypothetical protein [Candidatus Kaiserbacteria bacterium]